MTPFGRYCLAKRWANVTALADLALAKVMG